MIWKFPWLIYVPVGSSVGHSVEGDESQACPPPHAVFKRKSRAEIFSKEKYRSILWRNEQITELSLRLQGYVRACFKAHVPLPYKSALNEKRQLLCCCVKANG